MRAMLDLDIPLNAGCLVPLESKLQHNQAEPYVEKLTRI